MEKRKGRGGKKKQIHRDRLTIAVRGDSYLGGEGGRSAAERESRVQILYKSSRKLVRGGGGGREREREGGGRGARTCDKLTGERYGTMNKLPFLTRISLVDAFSPMRDAPNEQPHTF